ncbi:hypothetical protein QAD02_000246 [Eretmocerus hayati]|uniref:Uncharacterized protein n=1 Tax=Eretmocerus hayati TaxID=131215 RepID=A0ACC2NCX2_9HYME|nr:hypothetical protein QAD02_000246 [Eretmocerus hayati]
MMNEQFKDNLSDYIGLDDPLDAYQQAVRNNRGDLRLALAESSKSSQLQRSHSSATNTTGPRIVQHTTRSNKVVDTERTLERSELKQDGQIVTERKTTVEHEEIKDDELPEGSPLGDEVRETRKEASQRFVKRRDEDLVDYVSPSGERLAREMRFVSETTEAERTGDWQPDTSPAKLLRGSRLPPKHAGVASRADALTRKPLDLEEEDEARKVETSKWLESHFGSESRSSKSGSLDGHIDELEETTAHRKHSPTTNTSYINVTMKSSVSPQYRNHQHSNHNGHNSSHNGHGQLKHQHQAGGAGYFHGISEWSERYHSTEKQTSVTKSKSPSPQQYIMETTSREQTSSSNRTNGHRSSPDSPRIQHKDDTTSYSPRSYDQQQQQQQQIHSSTLTRRMHQQQRHSPPHERPKAEPPSPPLRRKAREQVMASSTTSRMERSNQYNGGSSGNLLRDQERERERMSRELIQREREAVERSASPVHVVQRTWESRSRDERQHQQQQLQQQSYKMHNGSSRTLHYSNSNGHAQHMQRVQHSPHRSNSNRRHKRSPSASRSISPSPVRRSSGDKNDGRPKPSKSPSPSKYKIGESFRKLVGKLRSGSTERRNKPQQRPPTSSQSQLTQTDDGSTYLQYNSVDRNIPLGQDYEADSPPERPPRPTKYRSPSPRQHHTEKIIHEHKETSSNIPHQQQQPIHRYYLGEDPFGGSIYGKEKGYTHSKPISRHRTRLIEYDYSGEPSSLGRFSKSTSRLAYEYGYNGGKEHELRGSSVQTLPRKMHHHSPTNATLTNNNSSYYHNGTNGRHHHSSSSSSSTTRRMNNANGSSPTSAPRYGSMINISFNKNGSPKTTTHYVHHVPPKPERSYKSSLSRSKSFNVEIADDGAVLTNPRGNITPTNNGHHYSNGYSSNNGYVNSGYRNGSPHVVSSVISSSTPRINKLRETPPLKSPGILASISRSNRDLVRNGRRDY